MRHRSPTRRAAAVLAAAAAVLLATLATLPAPAAGAAGSARPGRPVPAGESPDPTSAGPTSGGPTSAVPTSGGPTSGGPTSAVPTSGGPTSTVPVPTDPVPTDPVPTSTDPVPTGPAPTDPATTAPTAPPTGPTGPVPTGPVPTTGPTGPVPTGPLVPCEPPPLPTRPAPSDTADQLERVGHRILDLVDANGYPGFTGVSADIDGARLLLCWVRSEPVLPAEIQAIVAGPGEPVSVVRQYGDYSRADLNARVATLLGNPGLAAQIGGDIHTVTVPEEGTGLIAGVQPTGGLAPGAEATLSAAAGVPVRITVGPAPEPTTRRLDFSPWYAGARLTDNIAACTSGFGLIGPGNTQWLLTAYHCFAPAAPVFTGSVAAGGARIGLVGLTIPARDSEVVDITNGVAGSHTFTGGVADRTEGDLRVAGAAANIAGLLVCNSGSVSGELCGVVIRRVNVNYLIAVRGALVGVLNGVWATGLQAGQIVSAFGNSGGPIIRRTRPGPVQAMGTVSAASAKIPCMIYDARQCSFDVYYADIRLLLRGYGARLA